MSSLDVRWWASWQQMWWIVGCTFAADYILDRLWQLSPPNETSIHE